MRRLLFYLVPSLFLLSSVLVMLSGSYIKKAGGTDDQVLYYLEAIKNEVTSGQWEAAEENLENLKLVWKKVLPKLQFSIDREEAIQINIRLARLQGYLAGCDPATALAELYEINERWHNLTE
ncbi:MAG: DUF4363 family protein [Firmicutes bacterium]|nr:DUF4363 family protein [Bacillota bacterium]